MFPGVAVALFSVFSALSGQNTWLTEQQFGNHSTRNCFQLEYVIFPGTDLLEGRTAWGNCLRLSGFPKLRGMSLPPMPPKYQLIFWTEKF